MGVDGLIISIFIHHRVFLFLPSVPEESCMFKLFFFYMNGLETMFLPLVNLSPFPANSSFKAATNFSLILSLCGDSDSLVTKHPTCAKNILCGRIQSNKYNFLWFQLTAKFNSHETWRVVSYQMIFCLAAILGTNSWNRLCWYYWSRFCSIKG